MDESPKASETVTASAPTSAPAPQAEAPSAATPPPAAPEAPAPFPGRPDPAKDPKGAKAYAQLRPIGIMMALVATFFLVSLALSVSNFPADPPSDYLEADGGDLTVRLPGNGTASVYRYGGGLLDQQFLGDDGVHEFKDLQEAGVTLNATYNGTTWTRNVLALEGRDVEVRLDEDAEPQAAAWLGWGPPSMGVVAFQVAIFLAVLAGGTALVLRRAYMVAIFGSGVSLGLALMALMSGNILMALPLAGVGVFAILMARRARPYFGKPAAAPAPGA